MHLVIDKKYSTCLKKQKDIQKVYNFFIHTFSFRVWLNIITYSKIEQILQYLCERRQITMKIASRKSLREVFIVNHKKREGRVWKIKTEVFFLR